MNKTLETHEVKESGFYWMQYLSGWKWRIVEVEKCPDGTHSVGHIGCEVESVLPDNSYSEALWIGPLEEPVV